MDDVRVFVDANILIYAFDIDAGHKHEAAKAILRELWDENSGVLSMQVLQEFYTTVTHKLASPLPKADARVIVNHFTQWCIETGPPEIKRAFSIEDDAKISFWDALIVAAAVKSGSARILSEDLNPGQTISGVRVENPFAV